MKALCALAAVVAALAAAAPALADGDPASDYLLAQQVFLPFDVKFPGDKQQRFVATVAAANKAGYKIRVAILASSYDMGSITSLWRKPPTYARFLGAELRYVYTSRLLIVMPNGFGFNWPRHDTAPEDAVLAKIPIRPGNVGLIDAATTAVERLAAASGVKVDATPVKTHSTSRDRLNIIVAVVAVLVCGVLLRDALRRRRR